MRVAIYGKTYTEGFNNSIKFLFNKLFWEKTEILVYKPFYDFIVANTGITPPVKGFFSGHSDIGRNTNILFSIGGDGTYLEAVSFIRDSNIPIVGINSGRLGFLANISQDNLSNALDEIFNSRFSIENRTLIKLESKLSLFNDFNYALNEFTVHKKDSSSMITIQAYLNNEYLNTYWADGLIVSTPTGSTAYSMSAGGPIVTTNSETFIIAPLAPHNLTVRPIVIPDNYELRIRVEGRDTNYLVSLDYRSEVVDSSVDFLLTRAKFSVKSIKLQSLSYFETLRNKLMWGIDTRN
ncbi:MAG: NAD kinase [Bacteroidia bacterium]|nr:NAD kinase [Bacteroidia bacterium]